MREIRTLRSTRRGLETVRPSWSQVAACGKRDEDGSGYAPALDPTPRWGFGGDPGGKKGRPRTGAACRPLRGSLQNPMGKATLGRTAGSSLFRPRQAAGSFMHPY